MVKQYAQALGISTDEAATIAKNLAKEQAMRAQSKYSLDLIPQELRDFAINKAQYNTETGKFEVTTPEGTKLDLSQLSSKEGIAALTEMQREASMSDREAFMKGARDITTMQERLNGMFQVVGAMLAEKLMPYLSLASMWFANAAPAIASIIGRSLQLLITPRILG